MKVQNQSTEGGVIRIRKRIDEGVHGVSAHCIVVNPSGINELVVEVSGEKCVGKLSEKLLQESCNTVDIVLECFRVSKIHL